MSKEVATEPKTEAQAMADTIERLAMSVDVDPAKLQAILDVQERLLNKKAEQEFNQIMARLSLDMPRITKSGKIVIPGKDGKKGQETPYSKYEDIDAVIRPMLTAEGMSLRFTSRERESGGGVVVKCRLSHINGHYVETEIPLPIDSSGSKNNVQGIGSALSYGKRYCVCMLLNLVSEGEDDDAYQAGVSYITEAQVNELHVLLTETKSELATFMERGMEMRGQELTDIQTKDFARAKNLLMNKKAKMVKA
jgi:ERF superfamily